MKTRLNLLLSGLLIAAIGTRADTYNFGTGANQFSMEFVNIGHAGNAGETQDYGSLGGVRTFGSVGYNYRIGKFEVTADQFIKVHNVYDRVGDGNENHWNDGIRNVGPNAPATMVSWSEAAKFCNWLTSGSARNGAYQLVDGGWSVIGIDRASAVVNYGTVFALPTEDEWYKAAYFKADGSGYATYAHGDAVPDAGTDVNYDDPLGSPWIVDSGNLENNGTYDMDGNVLEWFESAISPLPANQNIRGVRGGSFDRDINFLGSSYRYGDPPGEHDSIGFRVAIIPEPSSVMLICVGAGGLIFYRRAKRRELENRPPSRKDFY